jgi:ligand-binding sensor domain-containing protein
MSRVYFATSSGILVYDKFRQQWLDPMTGSTGLDHRDLQIIRVDDFDDHLNVATSQDYFEYDELFDQWYQIDGLLSPDHVQDHERPAPSMHAPFGHTYSADGQIVDQMGRVFPLTDILDDGSGQLWLGTWGYGPARSGRASEVIEMMPYGLLQEDARALMLFDDRIWAAGVTGLSMRSGISAFHPERNEFEFFESGQSADFPDTDITCLAADEKTIYVGTPIGLLCLDPFSQRVSRRYDRRSGLPDDSILSVLVTGDTVLVGTAWGLGLLAFDGDSIAVLHANRFAGESIHDLLITDTMLWIGTSNGAYRHNLRSGELQRLHDPDQMLVRDVYAVEASGDNLWFASSDGVLRLNQVTGEAEPFPMILLDFELHAMAVNDEVVAVGTVDGLTLVYYADKNRRRRTFSRRDGLPSDRILGLVLDGDYLWIGSDLGLTRFFWNDPSRRD